MPLFALANAGVPLQAGGLTDSLTDQVTLGVLIGLIIGKQVGITLFTWIAIRTGLATMPSGLTWRHIYGVAWLGGIGFTMSLFITGLAFDSEHLVDQAKIGILGASLLAGVVGWAILRATPADREQRSVSQGHVAELDAAHGNE